MRVIFDQDLPIGIPVGDSDDGHVVPSELEGIDWQRLRQVDGEVIDGGTLSTVYVESATRLHAIQGDPSWQALVATIDDTVERDGTGTWVVVPAAEVSKRPLREYATRRCALIERGGLAWNGLTVMTDPESQQKLAAERLAVLTNDRQDGEAWVMIEGPVALTNNQITDLATAVRAWVKGLYATRSRVIADIDAGTLTAIDQIDKIFDAL